MPLGSSLKRILKKDEDSVTQEILYGHGQSKRSARCFIFILEDKTTMCDDIDDEHGTGTGRLFGVCVIHPRLLKGTSSTVSPADLPTGTANAIGEGPDGSPRAAVEFEAAVCYAFITRYPLFDFFFQMIWDIITVERLHRMEAMTLAAETDLDRRTYEYLPESTLNDVLERLSALSAPNYGNDLHFLAGPALNPIHWTRHVPVKDFAEHAANAAEWALPALLSWIPANLLVWTIGLLM